MASIGSENRAERDSKIDDQFDLIRQISQQLRETWQQSDPVNALERTLERILRQVDEDVLDDRTVSAIVYIYEDDRGFSGGVARGPLKDYMLRYPPREDGTGTYAIKTREALFVDDVSKMPSEVPPLSTYAKENQVKAFANLPLFIGKPGQEILVGILLINLQETYNFTPERQTLLRLFADQAAIVLQGARVHRRRLREQAVIQKISESTIGGPPGLAEETIVREVALLTKSDYALLWFIDPEGNQLELKRSYNADPNWQLDHPTIPIDDTSINGYVAKTKKAYYSADLTTDPYYLSWNEKGYQAALCVPLLAYDELLGTLYVTTQKESGLTKTDQAFVEQIAPHAAVTLYNVRLLEREQTQRQQAETLRDMAQIINASLSLPEVIDLVLDQLHKVLDYDSATVQLIRGDHRRVVGSRGIDTENLPPELLRNLSDDSLVSKLVEEKQPIILSSTKDNPLWNGFPDTTHDVNSWVGVPMVVRDDVVGFLTLDHQQPDYYQPDVGAIVAAFANQAASAIRNADLYRTLSLLNKASLKIGESLNPDDIYRTVLDAVLTILECDRCNLFLVETNNKNRLVSEARDARDGETRKSVYFERGEGLAGWVYKTGESLFIPDVSQESRYKLGDFEEKAQPRAMILSPIRRGNNVIGVVTAEFQRPNSFDKDDLQLLDTLTLQAGVVLQNIEFVTDFQILHDTANVLAKQPTLQKIYETAVEATAQLLRCKSSTLFTLDKKIGYLVPMATRLPKKQLADITHFKLGQGIIGTVAKTGRSIMTGDAINHPDFIKKLHHASVRDQRSLIVTPIKIEDEVIGVLSASKDELDGFTEHHQNMLETLGLDIGITINVRRQQDRLQTVAEFQEAISDILPVEDQLEQIYSEATKAMSGVMDTNSMFIALYESDSNTISFPLVYQNGQRLEDALKDKNTLYGDRQFGKRKGLTEWVISNKTPLLIEDFTTWSAYHSEVEADFYKDLKSCLVVPALAQEKIIGVIGLQNFDQPNVFDPTDQELLTIIARQAAIVLDNARQRDQIDNKLTRRIKELEAVSNFQHAISGIDTVEEELQGIYDNATKTIAGLMNIDNMFVALYKEDTGNIEFPLAYQNGRLIPAEEKVGMSPWIPQSIDTGTGLIEWVIRNQKSLLIEKAFEKWAETQPEVKMYPKGLKCWLGAPMILRNNAIGVIGLYNFEQEAIFDSQHQTLLETIAQQAAIVLDNAEKYDLIDNQLARQIKELEAVSQFQQAISSVNTVQHGLQEIYDEAAETMFGLMDTRTMFIALYKEDDQLIEFPLAYDRGRSIPDKEKVIGKTWGPRPSNQRKGLTEWIIRHKKPLLIESDFDKWTEAQKDIEVYPLGTKCWLGAPMILRNKVIGVIGLQNFEREGVFDAQHKNLLQTIASQAAIALDNAQILERRTKELNAISKFQQRIVNLGLD